MFDLFNILTEGCIMFYGKITERNINHAIIDWCNISYAIGFL